MQDAENKMRSLRATIQHLRVKNPDKPIKIDITGDTGETQSYLAEQIPTLGVILESLGDPDALEYSVYIEEKLMRRGTIIVHEPDEPKQQIQTISADKTLEKMAASMGAMMERGMQQIIEATNSRIVLMQEGFKQQIEAQNAHHKNLIEAQSKYFDQSLELALKRQELELRGNDVDWVEIVERLTEVVPTVISNGLDLYNQYQTAKTGGQTV
ncbi:hypothetical protein [Leptospira weilii]|uniref:hypothetical protein n=1 Tax=Leptospira weilii TaxID=28184 RepID=UPI00035DCDAA|nr:hypothetical protein [Leptospira weilii]